MGDERNEEKTAAAGAEGLEAGAAKAEEGLVDGAAPAGVETNAGEGPAASAGAGGAAGGAGASGTADAVADGAAKRRSREGLAIGAAVLVVLIVAAAVAYNVLAPGADPGANLREEGAAGAAEAATSPAPDFAMTDAEGATVRLSQLEGMPMVLNFWASTCGPCQSEMPGFQAAFEREGAAVRFVMVDIPGFNGESVERAKGFIAENGYTFSVYFDTEGQASRAYGLTSIPRTYFIDAEGNIVARGAGALSEKALEQGLAMIS